MKALRPSWGLLLPPTPQPHAPHQPGPPTALKIPTLVCLSVSLSLHQQCPNGSPSRALSLATRAKVRGSLSQEPVSHCNYLRQAQGSAQALNDLLNSLTTISLSPLSVPTEKGTETLNPLPDGEVLGRDWPGALLWGPLKVILWPGTPAPPPHMEAQSQGLCARV